MRRPIPFKASRKQTAPLTLTYAHKDKSLLTDLPFSPDHDLEDAITRYEADDTEETRTALSNAVDASLDRLDHSTGWHGSRASRERSYGANLDKAMLVSRKARRLSARLPVGPALRLETVDQTVEAYLGDQLCDENTTEALLHARNRATYKIGEGLLDAAIAMAVSGLLTEAKIFHGEGRNYPQRFMLHDAVFAAEDHTIEEMISTLIDAPNAVEEFYRDTFDTAYDDNVIEVGTTPLIYVKCVGTCRNENGDRELILEAVDFGDVDTLQHFTDAIYNRTRASIATAQSIMADREAEYY